MGHCDDVIPDHHSLPPLWTLAVTAPAKTKPDCSDCVRFTPHSRVHGGLYVSKRILKTGCLTNTAVLCFVPSREGPAESRPSTHPVQLPLQTLTGLCEARPGLCSCYIMAADAGSGMWWEADESLTVVLEDVSIIQVQVGLRYSPMCQVFQPGLVTLPEMQPMWARIRA